jgi:arabinogalactan endo-1,4-beta-galactosidase
MRFIFPLLILFFTACKGDDLVPVPAPATPLAIRGADLSSLPEMEGAGTIFYNSAGQPENMLQTLKQNGVNVVRIRLWNNPATVHSSCNEVKTFATRLQALGLKVWLTLHYSDTWADPGQQVPPAAWQGVSFATLKDSVYQFTKMVMQQINPEYIQIGNEINPGMLLPQGDITTNETQFIDLLKSGCKAVRDVSTSAKIIIHHAGINTAPWFFNKLRTLDYDMIGLSWYPIWHGKSFDDLKNTLTDLHQTYGKVTLVAETVYPFTLQWNDFTNNILGLESQIIFPTYPATPEGQKNFMNQVKSICQNTTGCAGFGYWGGELVAFRGPTATNGSVWENQAFYDFNSKVLPVVTAFAP